MFKSNWLCGLLDVLCQEDVARLVFAKLVARGDYTADQYAKFREDMSVVMPDAILNATPPLF